MSNQHLFNDSTTDGSETNSLFDDTDSFEVDNAPLFTEVDPLPEPTTSHEPWKILIVDDDEDVHTVTRMALNGYTYQNKALTMFHAYSAGEARQFLADHADIAFILLDVVMEHPDAGLALVDHIREKLANPFIRIVLRTGQPGSAPERTVIEQYEIDDYKLKTELTADKLFTTVTTSLRTYNSLIELDSLRHHLEGQVTDLLAEKEETIVKLQEVDRLKSQFIAIMSHELRTPLNAINGFAELLLQGISGELSTEVQDDVALILESGQHLLALINDILDISKIDAGQLELSLHSLDVTWVIEKVVTALSIPLRDKPVEMSVVISPNLGYISADPTRLHQILLNIVGNAIKFTPEGVVTIEVSRIEDENTPFHNHVLFSIRDTGIGIPVDKLERIFHAFEQVDMSHVRKYGGSGIGLAICQKLIKLHGGEMGVNSEPGVGSEFWFRLPNHSMVQQ